MPKFDNNIGTIRLNPNDEQKRYLNVSWFFPLEKLYYVINMGSGRGFNALNKVGTS